MRFTAAAVVPTGDFLAHVGDWTGLPPAELLGLMRGSASGVRRRVRRARAAGRRHRAGPRGPGTPPVGRRPRPGARRDCAPSGAKRDRPCPAISTSSGTGPSTASTSPSPARSSCPTRCCGPSGSPSPGETPTASDVEDRIADVRHKVPEQHRSEFDELLGEARLTYRLRDERGIYSDIWASGLMRRAVLAAGRRLAEQGRIGDAEHLVDAGLDEMCALALRLGRPVRRRAGRAVRIPRHAHAPRTLPPSSASPRPPRRTRPGCRPPSPD